MTISTNKIIAFVVFVCAALITSLFVYHTSHKPILTVINDGDATIFPVARDIKPFELAAATTNQPFTQHDLLNHWTILFFGFTHCSSICPATMNMLGHAYPLLQKQYPNLQVVLITLDPERDTLSKLSRFTTSFHPSFTGVTGKIQNIRKLQSQLGIFSVRDTTRTNNNYQIQHSSTILLIDPRGKWAGIFKYGMSTQQFVAAFNESMRRYD